MERIAPDRAAIAKRGKRLEYFSIAWNSVEGLLSVVAGVLAGSIALVGFGIDSFIEVTSAGALLWRMHVDANAEKRERNERVALRIVGACFVGLAIYVAVDSVRTLLTRETPKRSIFGIAIAVISLIAMPLLARAKRRVAASLNSAAMKADSRQTDFCMYLSSILLVGLVLNWLLGWWWADPLAALVMAPIIAKEGVEGLRAKHCDACTPQVEEEPQEVTTSTVVLESALTCPECGHTERETMPCDTCQFFYDCKACCAVLRPKSGDCCVFCSYGSVKCPPRQSQSFCS